MSRSISNVETRSFTFSGISLKYNDPHDIAAIIENFVLDVYKIGNIHKGDTVIDLGAGIGEFSVLTSKRVGKDGKVIAVEPSLEDYNTLLINLRENNCENVTPLNMAVSDRSETLPLEFKSRKFECKANSLFNILNDINIDSHRLKFMKMDIEGGERLVIPSSINIIKRLRFLAIEIHDGYSSDLVPLMQNLGFEFRRITRSEYLMSALWKTLSHPFESYQIFRAFKKSGEYPGFRKITNGIDISASNNLMVGLFTRL
jgi:FkbM family methyltransferase